MRELEQGKDGIFFGKMWNEQSEAGLIPRFAGHNETFLRRPYAPLMRRGRLFLWGAATREQDISFEHYAEMWPASGCGLDIRRARLDIPRRGRLVVYPGSEIRRFLDEDRRELGVAG